MANGKSVLSENSVALKASFDPKARNISDTNIETFLSSTNQRNLPQADILVNSVKALQEAGGLAEAYLRGSFSFGSADELSDIDLFVVVDPEKLEDTYNKFIEFAGKENKLIVSCHDRLVQDYGGIGFMFIFGTPTGQTFQFDLYMAMKGVPPKISLYDAPRVYSADPNYCWLAENRAESQLPEKTQAFIKRHTEGASLPEKMGQLLEEQMVTLYIMKKHLQRGQNARSLNDNNAAISVVSEMLMKLTEENTVSSPIYTCDKMIAKCKDPEAVGNRSLTLAAYELESLLFEPPSKGKIDRLYGVTRMLVETNFPEIAERMAPQLEAFEAAMAKKPAPGSQSLRFAPAPVRSAPQEPTQG